MFPGQPVIHGHSGRPFLQISVICRPSLPAIFNFAFVFIIALPFPVFCAFPVWPEPIQAAVPAVVPNDGDASACSFPDFHEFDTRLRMPMPSYVADSDGETGRMAMEVTSEWLGGTGGCLLFVGGPKDVPVSREPMLRNSYPLIGFKTGACHQNLMACRSYDETSKWAYSRCATPEACLTEDHSGKPSRPVWKTPSSVIAKDNASVTFDLNYGPIKGTAVMIQVVEQDAFITRVIPFLRDETQIAVDPPRVTNADLLQPGKWYYYRARAVNENGYGPWTAFSSATRYRVSTGGPPPEDVKVGADPVVVTDTSVVFDLDKGRGRMGAANLRVDIEIYNATNFLLFEPVTGETGTDGKFTVNHTVDTPVATSGVMYYYRVRYHAIDMEPEPWSDWHTYVVK